MTNSVQSNKIDAELVRLPDPSSKGIVHQLGYRGWSGWLAPAWDRWTVITAAGVQRAWKNNWAKRMLFFAWLPSLWFGICFFLWEQAAQYQEWYPIVAPALNNLPNSPVFENVKDSFRTGDFAEARHTVWAWLLLLFLRYPQSLLLVLIVGLIAPSLISQDIRSRAFLLYFSRPLTRFEYLLGKLGTLWVFLAMISLIPAMLMFGLGVILSPRLEIIGSIWDLPFRIICASIVLALPTSTVALCLSSLTQESRYAAFAWFAIWILGWFTYVSVTTAEAFNVEHQVHQRLSENHRRMAQGLELDEPGHIDEVEIHESVWTHLSPYHTLGRVQSWVFGFSKFKDVFPSVLILVVVTFGSLAITFRQISAPMRV